ncbi:hypothetical protein [Brucella anthropi]|uniref:hypothetical protein n=1 Tax=Brucella anthropi TaxID=529 RepID=UPI00125E1DF7|nr:hypothetical protein [Brucella anthropi]QFP61907.1 hypothetical protein FT787_01670 [Brucella anthropi]
MFGRKPSVIFIDELLPGETRWRHVGDRYDCERSRDLLSRFPDRADRIARRSVEAGAPLTKKQNPTVTGGLQ